MTRTVIWSRDALDDITAQVDYISVDNPSAAQRVARAIQDTVSALSTIPAGRPGRVAGTYEKSVSRLPYIIAYSISTNGEIETLAIVRVIHSARDWPTGKWPKA